MIKDYNEFIKELEERFQNQLLQIHVFVEDKDTNERQKIYYKGDNLHETFISVCRALMELSNNYEELEADFDGVTEELLDKRKENRKLKTCYMQHIETIAEQRIKINELEKIVDNLTMELGEYE